MSRKNEAGGSTDAEDTGRLPATGAKERYFGALNLANDLEAHADSLSARGASARWR